MPATCPPNARFWFFNHNLEWTKLTLKPGQVLRWHKAWSHEEGWSSVGEEFTHEGDYVRWRAVDDGRDCDGRLTQYRELTCPLTQLREPVRYTPDYLLPAWEELDRSQRDYTAEAAGY